MSRSAASGSNRHAAIALVAVALTFVLLGTVGCGRATEVEVPDEPAGITGQIKSIDRAGREDVWGSILVEGGTQPSGAVSDKAMVTISADTSIARAGRWIPPEDLAVGMTVRVWFEGPVAESYPVQGGAGFIEVQ